MLAEQPIRFSSDFGKPSRMFVRMEAHLEMMLRIASGRLSSRADAEDAVQRCCVRLLEYAAAGKEPRFESDEHHSGYIARAVINECISFHRATKKHVSSASLSVVGEIEEHRLIDSFARGRCPEMSLTYQELLDSLSDDERILMRLYAENYTLEEIKRELGASVSARTIGYRIQACLHRLSSRFGNEAETDLPRNSTKSSE